MNVKFEYTGKDALDIMSKYAVNRSKGLEKILKKTINLKEVYYGLY